MPSEDSDQIAQMCRLVCIFGLLGCVEGFMYLTSPGHQTDIGLQLGKACYSCSSEGSRGNVFISSVSSLSFLYLFYYLFYLFSLSLGDDTKWPTRVDMLLNPNTSMVCIFGGSTCPKVCFLTLWLICFCHIFFFSNIATVTRQTSTRTEQGRCCIHLKN